MSQVWRRSEVGNHKRRTLNTRLSSGTSEHTSSSSRNVPNRIIRSDLFWYWNKIKMKPTYRDKNELNWTELTALTVYVFAIKYMVHCGSAFEPGASGLPYYCTPPVCVPDVMGALAVWRQNTHTHKSVVVPLCGTEDGVGVNRGSQRHSRSGEFWRRSQGN